MDLVDRFAEHPVPVHHDVVAAPENAKLAGLGGRLRDPGEPHHLERAAHRRHRPTRRPSHGPRAREPREQLLASAPGRDEADAGLDKPGTGLGVGDDRVAVQQDLAPAAERHPGRRADHGERGVLHRPERALPEVGRGGEPVPCPGVQGGDRLAEVDAGAEVLCIVVDDEPRESVRHQGERLANQFHDRCVEGVHRRVEFQARDVAADVPQARGVVSDHALAPTPGVAEAHRSLRRPHRRVAAGSVHPPGAPVAPAVEPALAGRLQHRRHRTALRAQPFGEPAGAQTIRHLERTRAPVVAEAHGGIDVGDVVGDFRHERGRVGDDRREHPPRVAPLRTVVLHEGARPPGLRGLDAGETGAFGAAVFARGEINRLPDPLGALAPQAVEPALPLSAGVAVRDHPSDQLGHLHVASQRVVGREQRVHARDDVRHEVDADEVDESEDAGLRDPDRRPERRIGLLHAQARPHRLDHRALEPVHPDAVGDESRRVLALHHPLAEPPVRELAQPLDEVRPGLRTAHDFQQPHVPGRVEEVGDGEVPLQSVRSALHEPGERDGGGIRGDDGTGPAHRVEPRVEVTLHVEALHHRLDDPVRLPGPREVVVDVADIDLPHRAAVHEGGRAGFREALDRAAGDGATVRSVLRGDVEQEHARARVGEMGGDPAAHHPRADDRDAFDRPCVDTQFTASRTVAIPCPPPMHCVARGVPATFAPEQRRRLAGDARAGRSERMADGDRPTVDVHLPVVEPEVAHAGDRLRGERLVELHHVHIGGVDAGTRERLARRADRPDPHHLGRAARHRDALHPGERLEPVLVRVHLAAHHDRRRPVGERGRGARGHRPVLEERGLQVRQPFQARLLADAAVAVDACGPDLDRHDLGAEASVGARRRGPPLALQRERLLLLARDLVALRDVLRGLAHAHVRGGIRLVQGGVGQRVVSAHRHPRHRLDPGADEGVARVHPHRARSHVDRLHRRSAEAVDGGARHRDRQRSGQQCDEACDVESLLALGERAADDEILHVVGIEPGAFDDAAHHLRREVVGAELHERALAREGERRTAVGRDHRRAAVGRDDRIVHGA